MHTHEFSDKENAMAVIERTHALEGLDGIKDLLIHTDTFY